MKAGHQIALHPLDPLLASLALFNSPEELSGRITSLFNVYYVLTQISDTLGLST